jgi:hypothetical protein
VKLPFVELKAKAQSCLRQLLWPEPAGANFFVFNKCFDSLSDFKSLSGGPWNVIVDSSSSLVTFTQQEKIQSSVRTYAGSLDLVLQQSTEWKLKEVDEHHFKIYS